MLTDFKHPLIWRDGCAHWEQPHAPKCPECECTLTTCGEITQAVAKFYVGSKRVVQVRDLDMGIIVEREEYVRDRQLEARELKHLKSKREHATPAGGHGQLYTRADFGRIKTVEELSAFLRSELRKDKARTPITEQK